MAQVSNAPRSPLKWAGKILGVSIGAVIMAIALELFLIPNQIMDGGVVGIAIITSHLLGIPLGVLVFLLNIPFIYLGYKQFGRSFAILTTIGIAVLSVSTTYLHNFNPFTDELILATAFGGVILGVGVGTAIKFGGCLDGSEAVAIMIEQKTNFSVGQIIVMINVVIFTVAGFIFSWEQAMLSLLTYYIASKGIEVITNGMDETKAVTIMTDHSKEIADTIYHRLGRSVTFLHGQGSHSEKQKRMPYVIITRLEEAKLVDIVKEIDPNSMIIVAPISDVKGARFKKKDIH